MKVLAIVASARRIGNSEILAKEMLAALPESVEKKLLRLPELSVEPCKACYACLGAGAACVIDDDFNSFLAQVREADAIILASPVYFLGMHTRLKLLCDRLISVLNESAAYSGRRCVVAVPYGVEGWQGYGIEATVSFARFLHLDVVGVLPVHAANPGEAARPEILAKARELAGRLLDVPAETETPAGRDRRRQAVNSADVVCAVCGSGLLRISVQGGVVCAICGATGSIARSLASGRVAECDWNLSGHFRYSIEGMQEHARRLEQIKADFMARRHELAELRKPYKD
jgi:NAD(P)H-dependent FMN reductase